MRLIALVCCCFGATSAFQLSSRTTSKVPTDKSKNHVAQAFAAAALSTVLLLTGPPPALASDTAAQINLKSLPPSSVSIEIGDLPVVGSLLSGTYTKVPDGSVKTKPGVVIKSPSDKVKAISQIATGGHLEFDVSGLLNTHLDVDVAADEAGTARIVAKSPLIPKLPFRNLASTEQKQQNTGKKESEWNVVTNLGNGDSYYYNEKTGVTQYQRPDKI